MNLTQRQLAEQCLDKICQFYANKNAVLSVPTVDGRLNSAANEEEVINDIDSFFKSGNSFLDSEGLELYAPNTTDNREWYDFAVHSTKDSTLFVPVNIKVSTFEGADNLSCKLGIFWALCGIMPSSIGLTNSCVWEKYFQLLSQHIRNQEADYYFFVVDKNNPANVFWTSLKRLKELVPNANNLPFQCKWGANQEQQNRTFDEAKDFILSAFRDSIYREKKRELFDEYISPLIGLQTARMRDMAL